MGLTTELGAKSIEKELPIEPDFIIVGAMKSGTTSLHHILRHHSRVFIPNSEVQLFSLDDIEQNPVFFQWLNTEWTYQNFDSYFKDYVTWHRSLYEESSSGQVLGEDAPSYLPSRKAIDRIGEYLPDVKLIIMLRDPVARVFSHYWHWVRTYRAIYSLEDTIQFQHGNLLQRSFYEEQLRYCLQVISAEQIHVVLFEEFVSNQREVVAGVLQFLGLEDEEDLISSVDRHKNKGKYPRFLSLSLWRNRVFRDLYGRAYQNNIDWMPSADRLPLHRRVLLRILQHVNPMGEKPPIKLKRDTEEFLSAVLFDKNEGLPDLLDRDLGEYWPTFRQRGSYKQDTPEFTIGSLTS